MASPYYTPSGAPATNAQGSSSDIRSEFSAVETAMDKLPALTASYIVVVNSGGTSLESIASLPIAQGGTGAATFTDGGILLGSGTSAITALRVLTDGEMIVGDGTTDPAIESGATLRTSIGLGTTSDPTFRDVTVTSITTSGGGFDFDGSLSETEDTSDTNTRLGIDAGVAIVAGGVNNTAFGNDALKAVTTGDNCVAIGKDALLVNTASENTAIGSSALSANISSTGLTAVGFEASKLSTTGSITAVGFKALATNVTGTGNTAVGYQALEDVTDGANTAVGHQALQRCSTGIENTAVGNGALTDNNIGFRNTAVGMFANILNTTAGQNTCIGRSAGTVFTTGGSNIMIGAFANGSSSSGAGQITIGVSISCDQNNQVTIGNSTGDIRNEFDTDATWTRFSDERKKREIAPLELGLSFINDLEPVTYKWKSADQYPKEWDIDPTIDVDTDTVMTGMLAQKVKKALDKADTGIRFPGWGELDNGMQHISGEAFIFPLINAVNTLTSRLEILEKILKDRT